MGERAEHSRDVLAGDESALPPVLFLGDFHVDGDDAVQGWAGRSDETLHLPDVAQAKDLSVGGVRGCHCKDREGHITL